MIRADKARIESLLLDFRQLLKWNPSITSVKGFHNNSFRIHRDGVALNSDELVVIEKNNGQIIFHSTGGRLEYDLVFELVSEQGQTLVQENLYVMENNLPLELIKPIAKQAFNRNLGILKQLSELYVA